MRKAMPWLVLPVAAGILVWYGGYSFIAAPLGRDLGFGARARRVPDSVLADAAGERRALAEYRGTPMVVNVWATWCPYCREELVHFSELAEEYNGRVLVFAVNRGESSAAAREALHAYGASVGLRLLIDPDDAFYRAIGGFSMPETIFVDAEGYIRHHVRGPLSRERMRSLMETISEPIHDR